MKHYQKNKSLNSLALVLNILLQIITISAFSEVGLCPQDKVSHQLYKELKPFEGRFRLGSCVVEIQVCDWEVQNQTTNSNGFRVADLMVFQDNKKIYLPIVVTPESSKKYYDFEIKMGRAIYYRSSDKHPDPFTGNYEYLSSWIVKRGDRSQIESIEVTHSQDLSTNQAHKIICGADRGFEAGFGFN